jgi:hypothetical protein
MVPSEMPDIPSAEDEIFSPGDPWRTLANQLCMNIEHHSTLMKSKPHSGHFSYKIRQPIMQPKKVRKSSFFFGRRPGDGVLCEGFHRTTPNNPTPLDQNPSSNEPTRKSKARRDLWSILWGKINAQPQMARQAVQGLQSGLFSNT